MALLSLLSTISVPCMKIQRGPRAFFYKNSFIRTRGSFLLKI